MVKSTDKGAQKLSALASRPGAATEPNVTHIAEEIWQNLGHETMISTAWPEADETLLPIMKLRWCSSNGNYETQLCCLEIVRMLDAKARALESKAILRYLDGKAPKKSSLSKIGLSMWLSSQKNQNICCLPFD